VSLILCGGAAVWIATHHPDVVYSRDWGLPLMWKGKEIPAPPYRPELVSYPFSRSFAGVTIGTRWDLETPPGRDFYFENLYIVIAKRLLFSAALVVVVCLILPFYLLRSRRQHERELRGECQACGYNLTGNVSGVCPECGTPIKSKTVPIKNPEISN
jgi:hypothetical protein